MKILQKLSIIAISIAVIAFIPLTIEVFGAMNGVTIKISAVIFGISLLLSFCFNIAYKHTKEFGGKK